MKKKATLKSKSEAVFDPFVHWSVQYDIQLKCVDWEISISADLFLKDAYSICLSQ